MRIESKPHYQLSSNGSGLTVRGRSRNIAKRKTPERLAGRPCLWKIFMLDDKEFYQYRPIAIHPLNPWLVVTIYRFCYQFISQAFPPLTPTFFGEVLTELRPLQFINKQFREQLNKGVVKEKFLDNFLQFHLPSLLLKEFLCSSGDEQSRIYYYVVIFLTEPLYLTHPSTSFCHPKYTRFRNQHI